MAKKYTKSDFVKKAKEIHGDKYDYSLVNYINNKTKVKIICPVHGVFEQVAHNHLKGFGCYKCRESKGEKRIRIFLEKNNIYYIQQKFFKNCRDKDMLPFDFYLPEYNILIEYDGKQHFEINEFFGGESYLNNIQLHDKIKDEFVKKNNFKLLRIIYTDYNNIEYILGEKIG